MSRLFPTTANMLRTDGLAPEELLRAGWRDRHFAYLDGFLLPSLLARRLDVDELHELAQASEGFEGLDRELLQRWLDNAEERRLLARVATGSTDSEPKWDVTDEGKRRNRILNSVPGPWTGGRPVIPIILGLIGAVGLSTLAAVPWTVAGPILITLGMVVIVLFVVTLREQRSRRKDIPLVIAYENAVRAAERHTSVR